MRGRFAKIGLLLAASVGLFVAAGAPAIFK